MNDLYLIIMCIILLYIIQMLICATINVIVATRIPKNFVDFLKLTFLPWLLIHLKEVRFNEKDYDKKY